MKKTFDISLSPLVPILTKAVADRHREVRLVRCDICDSEDRGTPEELSERGWLIGQGWEICGKHD